MISLTSKYPGQRISLQNIFVHKWILKHYSDSMQSHQTAHLEVRTEKKFLDKNQQNLLYLCHSQSEILDVDNDYHVPTEKNTAITTKSKYIFEPPKNKFMISSSNLNLTISTNDFHTVKKMASATLRVTNEFNENMDLNTVNNPE